MGYKWDTKREFKKISAKLKFSGEHPLLNISSGEHPL
jgi:hypothetical protein